MCVFVTKVCNALRTNSNNTKLRNKEAAQYK